MKNEITMTAIASALGRSQSTITREFHRNSGLRGYRHQQAERKAQARHAVKPKAIKLTQEVTVLIEGYIKADWSPEQIAGRLQKENIISLHHETIYQFILADKRSGGDLYTHLRHQNKTYRKRYGAAHNRHGIPNRTAIDARPEVVNARERMGDWEADTMIGKNHKGVFVTLDERKSKLRLAMPVRNKNGTCCDRCHAQLIHPIKNAL